MLLDKKYSKGDIFQFRSAHKEEFVEVVRNELKKARQH